MKTELIYEDRKNLVAYRPQRAIDTIQEAIYNAKGGYFNIAVNRLQYVAYYAVSALLLKNQYGATTHAGVKALFSLHFVRTGLVEAEHGKTFLILFENRQSGDYEDFVYCDQEIFDYLFPKTKVLVNAIAELISK